MKNIKIFISDCDGVLTDGGMYYSESGDCMKRFNSKDGMGFQILQENGIITAIITGEDSEIVRKRAEKLNIKELHTGIKDKLSVLKHIAEKYSVQFEEIAYIGDDINDLECIKACGFSACPADAVEIIRNTVDYVCKKDGGMGSMREFADLIVGY